jgi:hypothetical protein
LVGTTFNLNGPTNPDESALHEGVFVTLRNRRRRERIILDSDDRVNFDELNEETKEIAQLALQDYNTKHDPGEALEHAVEAINRLCRLVEILNRRPAPT